MKCNYECVENIPVHLNILSSDSILEIIRNMTLVGINISIYFEKENVYVQSVKGESTLRIPLLPEEVGDQAILDAISFCYNNHLVDDAFKACKRGCNL